MSAYDGRYVLQEEPLNGTVYWLRTPLAPDAPWYLYHNTKRNEATLDNNLDPLYVSAYFRKVKEFVPPIENVI